MELDKLNITQILVQIISILSEFQLRMIITYFKYLEQRFYKITFNNSLNLTQKYKDRLPVTKNACIYKYKAGYR